MQTGSVMTPFGRPMTLALVKGQMKAAKIQTGKTADKWKILRDISDARGVLGLQVGAITVLDALLTFHPVNELVEGQGLVVFPSNAQLSVRAHGIAGTTLRRHLAALVDAGLIYRNDSPNGKRYAHRTKAGEIEKAFGFSLAPLLARMEELALLAQEVAQERRLLKRAKEALTLCRRDVRKLITAAVEEGADGDWHGIEAMYVRMISFLPRNPTRLEIEAVLEDITMLRTEILNTLEMQQETQKTDGNASQNGRHIQNSNPESCYEFEPSSGKEQGATGGDKTTTPKAEPMRPYPLGMVLKACPEIAMYGPGGAISSWREMMTAAVVVRSMLGVSPSAYQDACDIMGPENAATAIGCILERAGHITSPGGYLRDLTRKAARNEFALGPMLMALMPTNASLGRRTA
ncbi:replication initiation protein RepC [Agrobacterium tumefaciens]|uniref:plasmid replication protein RepC n=1 Tax=Agrobacterium tumefaciens TaxID=358 RepID=UPI0015722CD2|nr:plasmid replication protein RepC [Agrobacterium tumefaciens]MCZ7497281.1 plasmid replication protein RepC [Rhizobium rhizogenes]NTE56497.1 replication initiation protein RepC [Agrobacterium tumefaciens]NTE74465.1 replication initiation protein RepC [Agrobacterium tumefaciens]